MHLQLHPLSFVTRQNLPPKISSLPTNFDILLQVAAVALAVLSILIGYLQLRRISSARAANAEQTCNEASTRDGMVE
jgi:hypothetical protein